MSSRNGATSPNDNAARTVSRACHFPSSSGPRQIHHPARPPCSKRKGPPAGGPFCPSFQKRSGEDSSLIFVDVFAALVLPALVELRGYAGPASKTKRGSTKDQRRQNLRRCRNVSPHLSTGSCNVGYKQGMVQNVVGQIRTQRMFWVPDARLVLDARMMDLGTARPIGFRVKPWRAVPDAGTKAGFLWGVGLCGRRRRRARRKHRGEDIGGAAGAARCRRRHWQA